MKFSKIVIITSVALLATSLSACAPDSGETAADPKIGEWLLTERGDVKCLSIRTSKGYNIPECNWDTLTGAGTHTTEDEKVYNSKWMFVEDGQVFCLDSRSAAGYRVYDCDWSTLKR